MAKLKRLWKDRRITTKVLRKSLFAYVFPHLAWLFPFYPFLLKRQKEALNRKFRVATRSAHGCPFVNVEDLLTVTKQMPVEL